MFCDEPVLNVYLGREDSDDSKGESFFDAVNLVYHVTPLLRIVLVTEHWAITINSNGASKEPREDLAELEGEWLEETVHISEYDDAPGSNMRIRCLLVNGCWRLDRMTRDICWNSMIFLCR